ncbi:helix-turn-helix transcriptional regulator [Yersinia similis]|uniref:helix-turn-helix transcriptional regulator n=1 Tax=Yersinia similis TaxID=367190 RepID=UPI0011A8B58A|nr:AlpA family phage regulatory protein [Yersinia similis]
MSVTRILKKKEVLNRSGISNSTLYRLMAHGLYPMPKKLTGEDGRAVGWLESDVETWLNSRTPAGE